MANITAPFPSREQYLAFRVIVKDLKQGYSMLTPEQKWAYHGYDYGWRRAFMGRRDDNSPIDQSREWFSASMADRAERMFQDMRQDAERKRKELAARDPAVLDRDERFRRAEEWRKSPAAQLDPAIARTGPSKAWGFKSPAQALGVTAREWSPEEMSEARKQVGLE